MIKVVQATLPYNGLLTLLHIYFLKQKIISHEALLLRSFRANSSFSQMTYK